MRGAYRTVCKTNNRDSEEIRSESKMKKTMQRTKTTIAAAVLAAAIAIPVSASAVFAASPSGLDTSAILDAVKTTNGEKSFITYDNAEKQLLNEELSYSGLKLTGGTGASFDLGNFKLDDGRFFFDGKDFDKTAANGAWYDKRSDYGDIFSYVYTGTTGEVVNLDALGKEVMKNDLRDMTVTVRQVGKEQNYVSFNVIDRAEWGTECVSISAAATGNDAFKTIRYCLPSNYPETITGREYDGNGYNTGNKGDKQNKVSFGSVTRSIKRPGELETPISLIWDNRKVSAFTNVAYVADHENAPGIYGAWCIRDFDVSEKDDYYLTYDSGMSVWHGFDDGATVNVSVTFNNVAEGKTASIIVTSLGGYNLRAARTVVEIKDCPLVVSVANKYVYTGSEVTAPSAHYVNPLNGMKFATFAGTINLYRAGEVGLDGVQGENVLIKENLEAGYKYVPENAETLIFEYVAASGEKVTAEIVVEKATDETVDSDKPAEEVKDGSEEDKPAKKDNWFKRAWNAVKNFFKNVWQKVKDFFVNLWNKIKPGKNKKAIGGYYF